MIAWDLLLTWSAIVPWICGIALAEGFWQTFFAIFPPYACVIFAEWLLKGGCS